jgi:hypothetical protein
MQKSDEDFDTMGNIAETCAKGLIQSFEETQKLKKLIFALVDQMYWHGIHSNVIDAYMAEIDYYRCSRCHNLNLTKPSKAYHRSSEFRQVYSFGKRICRNCESKGLEDYYKEDYDVE